MSFIDLKKRRSRRINALMGNTPIIEAEPAEAPEPEVLEAVVPAPPEALAFAGTAIAPAAVPLDDPSLRALAVSLVPRQIDVLVVGLGPWGQAGWAEALRAQARHLTVLDPDAAALTPLRRLGLTTLAAPYDQPGWEAKLAGARYDLVIVQDALTHLADPTAFLRQVRPLVAEGGHLMAIVPNVAFGEVRLGLLKGEYPREFGPGAPLHHYTRARLRELFAFTGFTLAEVQAHEQPLFGPDSDLVPELFPDALLAAIGREDDMRVAHFVVKAAPASAEGLLRELFDEQEQLRKAVRNELAKATRTHDALTYRLKEADEQIERLAGDVLDAQRRLGAHEEQAQRAEHNLRRLEREAEEARSALQTMQNSLGWRLLQFLRGLRRGNPVESIPRHAEVTAWTEGGPKE